MTHISDQHGGLHDDVLQPVMQVPADIPVKQQAEIFLSLPTAPLTELTLFRGSGVYALEYAGADDLYHPLTIPTGPIYIGKATSPGSRTGRQQLSQPHIKLYSRLKKHSRSVMAADGLSLETMRFKALVTEDYETESLESYLIITQQPLWNSLIAGFGNNNPGAGRSGTRRSQWDIVHPGRPWAEPLVATHTRTDILASVASTLADDM